MKRLLLCVGLALSLVGCTSSPQWDKDEIESKVKANYTSQMKEKGFAGECTDVQLVPDGENKFVGFAKFSDGSEKEVTVNIDPKTGEFIF